jgi:hypothetical protein
VFFKGHVSETLRRAAASLRTPPAMVLGFQVVPETVRGPTGASMGPARLDISDDVVDVAGEALHGRLLAGGGRLEMWVTGLEGVAAGSSVRAVAVDLDGNALWSDPPAFPQASVVHFSWEWRAGSPPREMAIVIGEAS